VSAGTCEDWSTYRPVGYMYICISDVCMCICSMENFADISELQDPSNEQKDQ